MDEEPLFFFGAMSPYSWLAAERIDELLPDARWRGVLAGAVFKANGRTSWGFTGEREQKIADCEARAAGPWPGADPLARSVAHERPPRRPRDGPRGGGRALLRPYALAAMRLAFLEGDDLGTLEPVLQAARRVDLDPLCSSARSANRM